MVEILVKSTLGALAIAALLVLEKTGHTRLTGLAVWFPVITVAGAIFLSSEGGMTGSVREFVLSSVLSLPVWLTFAGVLYVAVGRFSLALSILISLVAWFAAAGLFVLARG